MRRAKFRDAVTLFATICIGSGDELPLVHVVMAGNALRLLDCKDGRFALRNMAGLAFDFNMTAFEWIHARGMFFHTKGRRLKSIHGMTKGTICTSGAGHELTAVIIGMAIHALGKCNRRLEIPLVVAVAASYGAVFSEKRISRLGMIEALQLGHLFPARCVVTRVARAFESALMRIGMAARASGERKSRVFDVGLGISHSVVAFCASHCGVRSLQRVFRSRVIKSRSRLPTFCAMASLAFGAELSAVHILMATGASAREP